MPDSREAICASVVDLASSELVAMRFDGGRVCRGSSDVFCYTKEFVLCLVCGLPARQVIYNLGMYCGGSQILTFEVAVQDKKSQSGATSFFLDPR